MSVGGLFFIPLILLFVVAIPVLIGVFVYRDAKRLDMDAVLWTLIAVFAPSCIGLIVYLVVRSQHSSMRCPGCSAKVEPHFTRCPACGRPLKNLCPNCHQAVEHTWKVCPGCGAALPENMEPLAVQQTSGKLPVWLLAAVIIIPVLLILGVCGLFFVRAL